jgi:hypothetical protein
MLTEPVSFEVAGSLDAPLFTGSGLIASLVVLAPFFVKRLEQRFRRA